MTAEVDYDVDVYTQQLDDLLTDNIGVLTNFKERLATFRNNLAEEEIMSKKFGV